MKLIKVEKKQTESMEKTSEPKEEKFVDDVDKNEDEIIDENQEAAEGQKKKKKKKKKKKCWFQMKTCYSSECGYAIIIIDS